jgi:hypothetical protein
MKRLIAGLVLALLTTSAQAQVQSGVPGQIVPGSNIGRSAEAASEKGNKTDVVKAKANEKAYNAALHNLPDKQYDPWHGVR